MNKKPLYICVGLAMTIPTMGALLYFVIADGSLIAQTAYICTKIFTLIWPLLMYFTVDKLYLHDKKDQAEQNVLPISNDSNDNKSHLSHHLKSIPLGLLTGLAIVALMFAAYKFTILGDHVRDCAEEVRRKASDLGVLNHFWLFAVFISLAHSLLEEYYWRWYVYGRLRELARPWLAYFLAGLSFAGHHYVILGTWFPIGLAFLLGTAVGIGGVIWCWMYNHQKSLLGIWISHALVDAGIMIIGHELTTMNQ